MPYDLSWLKQQLAQDQRVKYLFFWGHRPQPDGQMGPGCLSQWWERAFTVDGRVYPTAEHWMMARKAELFKDAEMLDKIYASQSPGEAKALGRKVRGFDQAMWEKARFEIVVEGNRHKFSQHADMAAYLLQTGHRVLVEASPEDKIWGIGLVKNDGRATQPDKWLGTNLLGFALMEVRDRLQQ